MKKTIKSILQKVGLLSIGQRVYFNLKVATPHVLAEEIRLRASPASDGMPVPPPNLIFDIIACRWAAIYLESGKLIVEKMIAQLDKAGIDPQSLKSVLDFGCGCGRLIRQVAQHTSAKMHGSDYNPKLVEWCTDNLPIATFQVNKLSPPLQYADNSFDFVYARSVLTHLPEELMHTWMSDLNRVLQPGGHLYFTMHGTRLAPGLSADELHRFNNDELVTTYSDFAGENLCATYATRTYVEDNLMEGFELVYFEPGMADQHLRQDVYIVRKTGTREHR